MFTPEGLARWVALGAADLEGGAVVVRGGGGEASSPIESVEVDGLSLTVTAVFGEGEGNFDWQERDVVGSSGVVIDHEVRDLGRKAGGAIWTVEATLELAPPA